MTILYDSRINKRRDIVDSFSSVQSHQGQVTFFNPRYTTESLFLTPTMGVPRRFGAFIYGRDLVWRLCQPRVGSGAPRSEAAFNYEHNDLERFYLRDLLIPGDSNHPDYWVDDTTSWTIVFQLHEQYQPNGGRNPPWFFAAYTDPADGIFKFRLEIAHDNGLGGSGTTVEEQHVIYYLGPAEKGRKYRLGVKCRAQGAVGDYLQLWLDGDLLVDYVGFVGFPDGVQNFVKGGSYTFFTSTSPPKHRVVYEYGTVIGDGSETLASMYAYMDAPVSIARPSGPRYRVACIGGTNVAGAGATANRGYTVYDPVKPSVLNAGSPVPAIADGLYSKGISTEIFNCASAGAGIVSYVGRCAGNWQANTKYVPGETVNPASLTGVTSYLENGLKMVCVVGGTSGGSEPTWPTTEYSQATDGTVTWETERRELYDVPGHYYIPGELGFDPLGLLQQALLCLGQNTEADNVILLVLPDFDPADNTVSYTPAITIMSNYLEPFGIKVRLSRLSPSDSSSYALSTIGKAIGIGL